MNNLIIGALQQSHLNILINKLQHDFLFNNYFSIFSPNINNCKSTRYIHSVDKNEKFLVLCVA